MDNQHFAPYLRVTNFNFFPDGELRGVYAPWTNAPPAQGSTVPGPTPSYVKCEPVTNVSRFQVTASNPGGAPTTAFVDYALIREDADLYHPVAWTAPEFGQGGLPGSVRINPGGKVALPPFEVATPLTPTRTLVLRFRVTDTVAVMLVSQGDCNEY